ncbi:FMN-binding protein [Sulfurimonas aquatica]|uniref:FMN-binding protein n=1 Tax=Sulfurimonas aquatica TaxID=2672570 RepID=A0A975B0C3_9BACT|nr:FMN-binding protein [Sulfurimonas aquatica]QSZ41877.1 FMN-binding protein [Sulfurimonas aquatica]
MKNIYVFLLLSLALPLSAKVLISPLDAMKDVYGQDSKVVKKNIMLSKSKFESIQKSAEVKLSTKIYRIFTATKDDKVLGYGVLVNNKVRSKNAVVLYFISEDILKSIEVIAFNEPQEYIPTKTWNDQFRNIDTDNMLLLNRDIPTITGATLSARSITDSSRVAFSIYNELLKDK